MSTLEKKSDSTIQTDFLSEYYSDWTSYLQSFMFTIYFYQQTWNKYETNRHFLSKKYNAFFTYNIVYILMKIIKSRGFFKLKAICNCLNDDVIYDGYNSKYSSGLCKMRFYQYHLFSFPIKSIFHLKKNISLMSTHRHR